jgi:hypothetical protein
VLGADGKKKEEKKLHKNVEKITPLLPRADCI